MKSLIFFPLTVFIYLESNCQIQLPKDSLSDKYAYRETVNIEEISKLQLFSNGKGWVLKNLQSADDMMEMDDKEFNSIISSGYISLSDQKAGGYEFNLAKLHFKLILQFKDGRYRYSIENFTYTADRLVLLYKDPAGKVDVKLEEFNMGKKTTPTVLKEIDTSINELIVSLKAAMASKVTTTTDW